MNKIIIGALIFGGLVILILWLNKRKKKFIYNEVHTSHTPRPFPASSTFSNNLNNIVLFISGYPDRSDIWREKILNPKTNTKDTSITREVSKFATVIIYDRPGTITIIDKGPSTDPIILRSRSYLHSQPVSALDHVSDLDYLLNELISQGKIPNIPITIVAHSAGGLCARLYDLTHPGKVKNMLLLDITNEYLLKAWDKEEINAYLYSTKYLPSKISPIYPNFEVIDFLKSFKELDNAKQNQPGPYKGSSTSAVLLASSIAPKVEDMVNIGEWPQSVLNIPNFSQKVLDGVHASYNLMREDSLHNLNIIIVPNSTHYIQRDAPWEVINFIKELVNAQRIS